ncbi:hypothetical protein [Bacillus toyonensis]|uniref:hypothetical protein n=1 Tax=Bacillus toyonensis TaxID=155322 RepID=UPI000BFD27A4|nr:hypothetical protein [Bacillus toyonensis]PHG57716.1 hypothetical protein COI59_29330 [Bacillus toyonensis]
MTYVMKQDMRKLVFAILGIVLIGYFFSVLGQANIIMVLEENGISCPKWLAQSLTTVGSVYGVQSAILSALGVAIAPWLALAIAGLGASGL